MKQKTELGAAEVFQFLLWKGDKGSKTFVDISQQKAFYIYEAIIQSWEVAFA